MTVHEYLDTSRRSSHDEGLLARESDTCHNCGALLTGPYCSWCGQKAVRGDLTLREFLGETMRDITHWDGKLPRTLKALFLEPGRLTLDVLAGRRARWLPPLRLYVICSLAYFLARPLEEAVQHRSRKALAAVVITNADGTKTLTADARREVAEGIPGRIFGVERLERAAANGEAFEDAFSSVLPKAMFVLVPVFAFLTRLMWGRQLPPYPAHLYLALHVHAAFFGAMAMEKIVATFVSSAVAAAALGAALLPFLLWYLLMTLRRVFDESWPRIIGKAAIVLVAYMLAMFPVSLTMVAVAVLMM